MSVEARKRPRLAPALTWLALAAPVVAGGYLVYQQHRAVSGPAAAQTAAPDQPQPSDRVWIVADETPQPLLRDPGRREDIFGRPDTQPAAGELGKPGKKRVISLGPSANPERPAPPPAPVAAAPAPADSTGPRVYQFVPEEPPRNAPAHPPRGRNTPMLVEAPTIATNGSSLSVGPGQVASGSNP